MSNPSKKRMFICMLALCLIFCISKGASLSETDKEAPKLSKKLSKKTQNPPQMRGAKSFAKQSFALGRIAAKASKEAARGGIPALLAGAVEVVSLMWLRTTVNYQYRYGVPIGVALRTLYNQGGIGRFYRGLPFALLQGPLSKFGSVAANEAAIALVGHISLNPSSALSSALGSVFTGLWRMFLMPIDTCKTVSQVEGAHGIANVWRRLAKGDILALYSGVSATVLMAMVSHYPWFFVHNFLEKKIAKAASTKTLVLRSAFIGFCSTAVANIVSNVIRVVKTVKQATVGEKDEDSSYLGIIKRIYTEDGIKGLFGRGLKTRIFTDGLQNMLFTVTWKLIAKQQAAMLKQAAERAALKGNKVTTADLTTETEGVDVTSSTVTISRVELDTAVDGVCPYIEGETVSPQISSKSESDDMIAAGDNRVHTGEQQTKVAKSVKVREEVGGTEEVDDGEGNVEEGIRAEEGAEEQTEADVIAEELKLEMELLLIEEDSALAG